MGLMKIRVRPRWENLNAPSAFIVFIFTDQQFVSWPVLAQQRDHERGRGRGARIKIGLYLGNMRGAGFPHRTFPGLPKNPPTPPPPCGCQCEGNPSGTTEEEKHGAARQEVAGRPTGSRPRSLLVFPDPSHPENAHPPGLQCFLFFYFVCFF